MDEIVGVVYDQLAAAKPVTSMKAHDQSSIAEFSEANRIYLVHNNDYNDYNNYNNDDNK